MKVLAVLGLCLAISAFQILTPQPGEVVSVDEIYNLTWEFDNISSSFILSSIKIDVRGPVPITYQNYSGLYLNDSTPNVDRTAHDYPLNLSSWWGPFYNDASQSQWTLTLELRDSADQNMTLNDTVSFNLASAAGMKIQRPQLTPLSNFTLQREVDGLGVRSAASGVLPVVLGLAIPISIIAIVVGLLRYRWKRHAYGSLLQRANVVSSAPLRLNPTQAFDARSKTSVSAASISQEFADSSSPHHFPWNFVLAGFLAIVPLLSLFVALMSLLLAYRVESRRISRPEFAFNESSFDPAAFYVDFDATRYTTVASWTSSVALLLPGFLTSLIWYHQAQQLENDACLAKYDDLSTPYQLALLLNLKSGTLGSVWEYISYVISRRREKQGRFLLNTGFVVLLSTSLGFVLWMADTWLHIGTSTIPITTVKTFDLSTAKYYGRIISYYCTLDEKHATSVGIDMNHYCILDFNVDTGAPPQRYASMLLGRDPDVATIPATIGQERLSYIGPSAVNRQLDYHTKTLAVRSVCQTIDEWCWLPTTNYTFISARCGHFSEYDLIHPEYTSTDINAATKVTQGVVNVVATAFNDQSWALPMAIRKASNSFYTVSRLDSPFEPSDHGLRAFSNFAKGSKSLYTSFIGCHTQLVNFEYTFVNGSIRSANMTELATTGLINTVYRLSMKDIDPFITNGAAITALANDSTAALRDWADTLNKHYLSIAATGTETSVNLDQQERFTRLVARIPKAPIFTLMTLIMLSILLNTTILVMSLWGTSLRQTEGKQMVVSIAGLAANAFESMGAGTGQATSKVFDMFEESKEHSPSARVGIGVTASDGTQFVAYSQLDNSVPPR